jgi:AbiU2
MTYSSADQIRAQNVAAMGHECGSLYTDLVNEITWLHAVWRQYRVLFGTSEKRMDFLNDAAGLFFRVVQDSLWEGVLLHICRLTDKETVSGKETLTIRRLPGVVPDVAVAASIQAHVDGLITQSAFARDWRNRHIAHRDLILAQNRNAVPLAPASRADVESVLATLRNTVNAVGDHYFKAMTGFEYFDPPWGAETLLYWLRLGRMLESERRARMEAGEYHPEDFRAPPEV